MWIIVAGIFLLLIWGNLSKKSPNHPLNKISVNPKVPLCSHKPTAGDNFNSGQAIATGVPEGCIGRCDANRACISCVPHFIFPIDPPPIAIQKKIIPVKTPVQCQHITVGPIVACDAKRLPVCNNLGRPPNNLSTRLSQGSCRGERIALPWNWA
jgi:hypothetical protein